MNQYKFLMLSLFILSFNLFSYQSVAAFTQLPEFGENPGELSASYLPANGHGENLVVLLHGCIQNGELLAQQSGLSALAAKRHFSILIPQQSPSNNIKNCFNWYSSQDAQQNVGESLSIKNMIIATKKKLKAKQVYLLGLSGGGAMAAAMLVNYPQLFEAGAVIAGIPFPCADTLIKAIACMRTGPSQSAKTLSELASRQHNHGMKWPRLTIWTGLEDTVVHPSNSIMLAQQWQLLQQIKQAPTINQHPDYKISQWLNDNQQIMVELIELKGIGHGMSVNPAKENGGIEAPFLLKSPLSAVVGIVDFWQL